MKYFLLIATLVFTLSACDNTTQKTNKTQEKEVLNPVQGTVYGIKIEDENVKPASNLMAEMDKTYEKPLKLEGTVDAVCQMTGCWIDMDLGDGEIVHVTFKDEAFTLPKDIAGKNAVIEGVHPGCPRARRISIA